MSFHESDFDDSWPSSPHECDVFDHVTDQEQCTSPTPFDDDTEHFKSAPKVIDDESKTDSKPDAPSEPKSESKADSKAKRLEKLNLLIERSKVYSSMLGEQIARSAQQQQNTDDDDLAVPGKRDRDAAGDGDNSTTSHKRVRTDTDGGSKKAFSFRQPSLLTGATLHDYQLEGVSWLAALYENGLNGILADDMGLGKTIQTIAFLAYLVEHDVEGLFLIVSPLATLDHWQSELKKFAPALECACYYGTPEEKARVKKKYMRKGSQFKSVVIITTYDCVVSDISKLVCYRWKYLVIDEGQRLKNINSVLLKKLKKLKTSNRLLLSGTPLQNNMHELWTLLNFLLPDIFSYIALFETWFKVNKYDKISTTESVRSVRKQKKQPPTRFDPEIVTKLHDILRPFLLRRLKSSVLKHLPPKREYLIYTRLSDVQLKVYQEIAGGRIRQFLQEELLKAHDPTGEKGFRERDAENRANLQLYDFPEVPDDDDDFEDKKSNKKKAGNNLREIDSESDTESDTDSDFDANTEPGTFSQKQKRTEKRKVSRNNVLYTEPTIEDLMALRDADQKSKLHEAQLKAALASGSVPAIELDYARYLLEKRQIAEQKLISWMTLLRQVCNSPFMMDYPYKTIKSVSTSPRTPEEEQELERKDLELHVALSGKMQVLDVLAQNLVQRGHRLLIFSQFLGMLDIIHDWADHLRGWNPCRIDGTMSFDERKAQIKKFNTICGTPAESKVFLLSTRAGGLGLNLTSADTVIIFDSDWNPQIDLQAMDRAHRIGQSKPVVVYRLASSNTIEQRLLELAGKKRHLEKVVIEGGDFSGIAQLVPDHDSDGSPESYHSSGSSTSSTGAGTSMPKSFENLLGFVLKQPQLENLRNCHESMDFTLTPEVLEKILDRSPEAYSSNPDQAGLPDFVIPV